MKPKIAIPLGVAGMFVAIGTPIANANHLFDGHPTLAYWFYGAAIALIVVALVGWILDAQKKPNIKSANESDTSPPPATAHQGVKQEANPQINSQINPHFNISVGNASATATAPAPEKNDEPRCNIEFLDVEVETNTNFVGKSMKTACAIFENEHVDGQKLRTPTLKGRLIFKHPDGHIVLDLSNVAWWPDEQLYAPFSANSPRQLLLFFSPSPEAAESNLWARSVHPSPARIGAYKKRVREGESHAILEQIQTIEVQLLTETECLYRKILEFEDDASGFPKFVGVQN
jgi:hypothetical protein